MKLSEVPASMIQQFEQGYRPTDEPPGLEEVAYRAWIKAGGKVKTAAPEPATWAICELLGHKTLAGRLTEEEKFGVKLARLDIPQGDGFITQYFSGGSVYRISIVSEQVARDACKRTSPAPVEPWDYPKAIAATPTPMTLSDDWEDGDEDEEPAAEAEPEGGTPPEVDPYPAGYDHSKDF